jgi:hypothetical protein
MSRLRRIIVDGDEGVLKDALADVRLLSSITHDTRNRILRAMSLGQVRAKIEIEYANPSTSEVPSLFRALNDTLMRSRNAHYQLAIILWYMLFDSELFGRFMLQNESHQFKDIFMKSLKESTLRFIAGHQTNGEMFKPTSNLNQRCTGTYVSSVRDLFATL